MAKYIVSNEVKEPVIPVWLEGNDFGYISFRVGNETIFKLHPDGTGELTEGIPKDNRMGLQVFGLNMNLKAKNTNQCTE